MKIKHFAVLLLSTLFAALPTHASVDWTPDSLKGLKAVVVVDDGGGILASYGGYRLSLSPTVLDLTPLTANIVSQSFTYKYLKLDATHALAAATEPTTGAVMLLTLVFTSPTSAHLSTAAYNPGTGPRTGTPSVTLRASTVGNIVLASYADLISGFTASATLDLSANTVSVVTSAGDAIGVQSATMTQEASPNRFVNLSTRGKVGTGNDVLIAGPVVTGTAPKRVLIRAAGPALATIGVPVDSVLANPVLTLHRNQNGVDSVVATNDDWSSDDIGTAFSETGAFSWTPGSKDSALLMTLEPGLYTAIVTGANATSGIALLETYEVP